MENGPVLVGQRSVVVACDGDWGAVSKGELWLIRECTALLAA